MAIINPTEEQLSEWLSQQTMRGGFSTPNRLADLVNEPVPMNSFRNNSTGRTVTLPSIQEQGGMSLDDLLAKTGATMKDKVDVQGYGPGFRLRNGGYAGLDPNGKMWELRPAPSAAQQLAQLNFQMKQRQLEGLDLENQTKRAALKGGSKPQFVDGQWVYPPSQDAPMGRAIQPEGFKPKKDAQAETGKETVSKVLGELKGAFGQLSQKGAAIDTTQGTLSNIQNRIAASAPGQMVTGAIGTEEQSIRNTIAMTRPLLIQAIRQATGMSAKAMDSNAELQFYLQAATDPTKDLQANMKAIEALDRAFGLGLGVGGREQAQQAQNPGMAVPVTSEADAMRLPPGTRFKLPDGRTGTAR